MMKSVNWKKHKVKSQHNSNIPQRNKGNQCQKWKELREIAHGEAKTISENLKELRENKNTQQKGKGNRHRKT